MLKVLSLFVVYSFTCLLAQSNGVKVPDNILYEETGDGLIKIKSPVDDSYYLKNIKPLNEAAESQADFTIRMDTLTFAEDKYYTWKVIDIASAYKVVSLDGNNDGFNEVYGIYFNQNTSTVNSRVYQFTHESSFEMVYEIDSIYNYRDFGDIERDGLMDIVAKSYSFQTYTNSMYFFTQKNETQYVNKIKTVYDRFISQTNNTFFYDIDGDGNLEIIYFLLAGQQDSLFMGNHVAKYNKEANEFELVYHHRPNPDYYTYGFSYGDFDMDGKGNFATGSSEGDFYIYEHVEDTVYTLEFRDTIATYNAYLTTFSNDLNGNGKPELWICGDFFSSIYGDVTRAFVYEHSGSGYEKVFQIDIKPLFSWDVGNMKAIDIDKDGKEEVLLYTDQYLFVFNWDEDKGYYLNFAMKDPRYASTANISRNGVDVLDIDSDGELELAFQFENGKDSSTIFIKRKTITGINETPSETITFMLHQNYPNPFNNQTSISFRLPLGEKITIRIYNVLGEEIKEIISTSLRAGDHKLTWDGSDNYGKAVPSGIYFLSLISNSYHKTIKTVLIK